MTELPHEPDKPGVANSAEQAGPSPQITSDVEDRTIQVPQVPYGAVFAENLGLGITIAGLVVRLLVPTESAAAGDTLWIACLQLIGFTIFLLGRWQAGYRFRFDPLLCCVGVVVLGHIVSGGWIYFFNEGNKRQAVNLVWEWLAIGAVCCVVRRRLAVAQVVLAMVIVVAAHGIWQYYVDFPALRAEYASSGSALTDAQRLADLKARGIPVSESGLQLFADRLASLEPLGPFALANTLGGFLAVGVSLGLATLLSTRRSVAGYLVGLVLLSPIAYCLVLTKSRTAMVAVAAGVVLFVLHRFLNHGEKNAPAGRSGAVVASAVGLISVAAVIGAVLSGGLDQQVISESPKSLQYRLMYWQGTIATLRESPIFGTGPGNFRQRYTAHKLAASSEEILDPHNLLLDAWCNAGIVGLIGLVLLLVLLARAVFRTSSGDEVDEAHQGAPDDTSHRLLLISGLAGFAVLFAQQFLTGQERILLLLGQAITFAIALCCTRFALGRLSVNSLRSGGAVAGCVLVVHLLGAGGFTMPAVMQVLVLLVAVAVPAAKAPLRIRKGIGLVPAFAAFGVTMVCVWTVIGTTYSAYLMRMGQTQPGMSSLEFFGNAALVDGLGPDADRRYAERLFEGVRAGALPVPRLSKARAAWARASRRDPYAFTDYRSLAMSFSEQFRQTSTRSRDPEWRELAVLHMKRAVERYPTSPMLQAELAMLQDAANQSDDAKETAKRALELDDINHEYGHKDRYLPILILSQLNRIQQRKIEKPLAAPE